MNAPGRRILVVGYGRTGQAVARVLASRGDRVRACDVRSRADLGAGLVLPDGVELCAGTDGPETLAGIELVVPSPGVPVDAPILQAAVARGIAIESEIEVAAQGLRCPVVAITGTNGKSTTTTLVGLALARSGRRTFTGGNLGTPLIAALDGTYDVCVAEVSSFQLEWVRTFRPAVGCLLNVTPDHLDRHGTFEAYRAAKMRLFAAQRAADWAVLNRDDGAVMAGAAAVRARQLTFGWTAVPVGAFADGPAVVLRLPDAQEERYSLGRTRLVGRHQIENVLAAVATARLAGATANGVQQAIDEIEPLAHRLSLVAERDGVRWFDDSKATNVGAAVKSLESFADRVLLLAGGVDKGGSYAPLAATARGRVRRAFVFGAAQPLLATALEAEGIPVERVPTLEAAVRAAAEVARRGDTVVLAPACSSFDQFRDYVARGQAFSAAVARLGMEERS